MARRFARLATAATALTVLAAGGATDALATPHAARDAAMPTVAESAAVSVAWHTRFRFDFDQGESLQPGTRVIDTTGNRHPGVVRVSGPGQLKVRPGVTGKAAGFPRRGCATCGRAIIQIRRNAHLNPWRHPVTFGASVKVRARWAKPGRDPNIVQKGLWSRSGVQWKLQLLGARPSCVFNGSKSHVNVTSDKPINDGAWHQVTCRRVGPALTLTVDGNTPVTKTQAIGRISNKAPVTVGGRAVGTSASNDQFHGNIDNVFFRVGTLR